jgi:subtilisin-like proprotein convertase family protein
MIHPHRFHPALLRAAVVLLLTALSLPLAAQLLPGNFYDGVNEGPIPDGRGPGPLAYGAPRDVYFEVSGQTGSVEYVAVTLLANHSWVGDLKVQLIAPDGRSHLLFERTGATDADGAGSGSDLNSLQEYIFGDDVLSLEGTPITGENWWSLAAVGSATVPATQPIATTVISGGAGVSNPPPQTSMTATFASADPNGTWILRIEDGWAGDTGAVDLAVLTLKTDGTDRLVTSDQDSGPGSLREAILAAQAGDAIRFVPTPEDTLMTINLSSRLPPLPDGVGVFGPGHRRLHVQRSASNPFRIFEVGAGDRATISGLRILNGNEPGAFGGGVLNEGHLTLADVVITDSLAEQGGGVANFYGDLTLLRSQLFRNASLNGSAGVYVIGDSNTRISDSIIGFALTAAPTQAAVRVFSPPNTRAALTLENSILSDVGLSNPGIGLSLITLAVPGSNSSISATVSNTIFDNLTNLDIVNGGTAALPQLRSAGFNLATDTAGGYLDQASDRLNADPMLQVQLADRLAAEGVLYLLGAGSQAIDAGCSAGPVIQEIRGTGFNRTVDLSNALYPNAAGSDGTDIGAVEMRIPPGVVDALFSDRFSGPE